MTKKELYIRPTTSLRILDNKENLLQSSIKVEIGPDEVIEEGDFVKQQKDFSFDDGGFVIEPW